jgi:hypothetical protein
MAVTRELCHLTRDGDLIPGPGPDDGHRLWPYTQNWRYPWRRLDEAYVDPVNLYVIGAGPDAVMSALASAGWARPEDGAVQRTWIDGRLRRMADHSALGPRERRFHVRLWPFGRGTIGAAHHERLDEREDTHRVMSWDRARAQVVDDLEAAGLARLAPSAVVAKPGVRGLDGDGRVWRLVGG